MPAPQTPPADPTRYGPRVSPAHTDPPVADVVTDIKEALERRLAELRPLVSEYRAVEAAFERLGGLERQASRSTSRPARRKRTSTARRTRASTHSGGARKRAPRGHNLEAIIAAVRAEPGLKPAQLAEKTAISKGTVAATVSKLKRDGRLKADRGGGLRLGNHGHAK
jgi:hypothetical protein